MYQVPGRVYGGEQNLKKNHHGPSAYGANAQGEVRSQWKHVWGSVLGGQRARREGGTRSGGRTRRPGSGRPSAGRAATAASAGTAPARGSSLDWRSGGPHTHRPAPSPPPQAPRPDSGGIAAPRGQCSQRPRQLRPRSLSKSAGTLRDGRQNFWQPSCPGR